MRLTIAALSLTSFAASESVGICPASICGPVAHASSWDRSTVNARPDMNLTLSMEWAQSEQVESR